VVLVVFVPLKPRLLRVGIVESIVNVFQDTVAVRLVLVVELAHRRSLFLREYKIKTKTSLKFFRFKEFLLIRLSDKNTNNLRVGFGVVFH
jgi:hypothetical protein